MPIDLPQDYDNFKAEVLADQERDSQGVYEVWWSANTRWPELALSTRLAIAESVVGELIREERVSLVRGEWIGLEHERVAVSDTDAVLREWASWVLQTGEAVVWMADN